MKKKALKNIPKPDENKLAIFYGRESRPDQKNQKTSTVDNVSTVDKMPTEDKTTTVDKMSTVVNETSLRASLKSFTTNSQRLVYLSLYKQAYETDQDITSWIGYGELAKEMQISLKTVQRAIERLIELHLIERIKISNTAELKGSKYRIFQPTYINAATADKMSTVDKNK